MDSEKMGVEKPRKPRAARKSKSDAPPSMAQDMTPEMTKEMTQETSQAVTQEVTQVMAAPTCEAAQPTPAAPEPSALTLNSSLEIKDVEGAHRQFMAALDLGSPVTVDIGRVAAMDTAGVQLILAFQSEAAKRGVAIQYRGDSTAFTHALAAVGLRDAVHHAAARE